MQSWHWLEVDETSLEIFSRFHIYNLLSFERFTHKNFSYFDYRKRQQILLTFIEPIVYSNC